MFTYTDAIPSLMKVILQSDEEQVKIKINHKVLTFYCPFSFLEVI